MTGIIGAMDIEIAALKAVMKNPVTETVGGLEFVRGEIKGEEVVAAVCGVGKVFAALCAQTMILRYGASPIINTGVAGSLTDSLGIGGIAVATAVVQHDMDTTAIGDPPGLISGINLVNIPADAEIAAKISAAARRLGIACLEGTIASGDRFVATREEKAAIAEKFGAIACEMEGAAIGQTAYVNSTPFAVIRSISDSFSGRGEVDFEQFKHKAAENSTAVLLELIG